LTKVVNYLFFSIIFLPDDAGSMKVLLMIDAKLLFIYLFMFNQVIFVPDYNVSVAEMLIPASELSQHIR
jgi:glucan phosphorylase